MSPEAVDMAKRKLASKTNAELTGLIEDNAATIRTATLDPAGIKDVRVAVADLLDRVQRLEAKVGA